MKNFRLIIFSFVLAFCTLLTVSCGILGGEETPHILTRVEEVPATCTSEGTGAYYICSGCDLLFDDAEGKYRINAPKVLPIVHNPEIVLGKEASCTEDGHSAYRICKDCGEIITPSVVLPAQHSASPTASLWGVTMEVIDGRAYLVIYGGDIADNVCSVCEETVPLNISCDLQHNNNIDGMGWKSAIVYANKNNLSSQVDENTIVKPSVEAKIKGGLFEAYFDITDLSVGSTLTIHAGLDGAMADLKNQGSGNGVAVFADGKKFSFRLDSDTWKIASIVVSEAQTNEFNLNGRVNLAEIGGKPYLVYQGAWNTKNGSKTEVEQAITEGLSSTFDIMELNTWATPDFDYILDVADDGRITLSLCLENLAPSDNVYYMHRALDNTSSGGDVKLPTGHGYMLVIGNLRYTVVRGSDAASWLSSFTVIHVTEITA